MVLTLLGASASSMAGFQQLITQFGPMLLIMVLLVVVMILPQRRQQKKVKQMMSSLKEGDCVRTIGGFYGKIVQVKEDVIMLEIGPDKVRMPITKGAIATVENNDVVNESSVSK